MSNPRVSVIIPTYNVEAYIEQSLRSVLGQTMKDIEILVSDDCSTDNTLSVIRSAAGADRRVKILLHDKNCSASQCRKDAVLVSRGRYVMFVDGDDYLEPTACETAYNAAVRTGAEVLQYGTRVENCGNVPQERIDSNQRDLTPYLGPPLTMPLVTACFEKNLFSVTLWNKIFSGEIVRRAFANVEDGAFPKANDAYALFLILLESKRYHGIEDTLCHYCFGRGMTGRNSLSLASFRLLCRSAEVYRALDRFISARESADPGLTAAREALKALKDRFMNEQFERWLNNVSAAEQPLAADAIKKAWNLDELTFLTILAARRWYDRVEVANALAGSSALSFDRRRIRTVALYYHSVRQGGAQRVVAILSSLLSETRDAGGESPLKVILVTDEGVDKNDYSISPRVIREIIPRYKQTLVDRYGTRARAWASIISRHQVDAVLYSEWMIPSLLWDLLTIKSSETHPAVVLHLHGFCGMVFRSQTNLVDDRSSAFRLADGLVTLSDLDRRFWSRINPATYYIPNPCFSHASRNRRARHGKSVLWLARLAAEKQPMQVLDVMQAVVAEDPEVVCHVVGNDTADFAAKMTEELRTRGLENNVFLDGFRRDVAPCYENASVFLLTSLYEGFTLTLYEASSFGLPVVMYDLPWLSFYEIMDGWTSVPQGDASAAAKAILALINDPALWQEKSDASYASALAYEKRDIAREWIRILRDLEQGVRPDLPGFDPTTRLFLDQISYFHGMSVRGLLGQIQKKDEKIKAGARQLASLRNSWTFRIGRLVTAPIRLLRRFYRRILPKKRR